jgi:hypothetical protein
MKRLLVLAGVVLAAGTSGCRSCGNTTAHRPCQAVATPCQTVASPCCGGTESFSSSGFYTAPGTMSGTTTMQAPTMAVPQSGPVQTFPGPEAYTPAN